MNKPKMIIFDFGQTLVNEKSFDMLRGTKTILSEAVKNPNNVSAEDIQSLEIELSMEVGRYWDDEEKRSMLEVHNHIFQRYIYEYLGIELTKSLEEVERIFINAAISVEPTKNVVEFLEFLDSVDIRMGVISNITSSEVNLKERINKYIPSHKFEFIIASSEYIFRKPHKRIFELALRKAKLDPCEVWYCGDKAAYDVEGAANCGIFPVWYKGAMQESNKSVPKSKCLEISDWKELIDILQQQQF